MKGTPLTAPADTGSMLVARPHAGEDCTQISAQVFERPHPEQNWSGSSWRAIAAGNVQDQDLLWFSSTRSISEALAMAFGEQWRVDALPSVSPDGKLMFLLTDREVGWRLLTRLRPKGHGWCTDIDEPRGELTDAISGPLHERHTALAGIRREWLAGEVADTTGFATLREALGNRNRRALNESVGADERAYARGVRDALVEVWLAEQGYTAADAQAVRTMVALAGLPALKAYDRTSPRSIRKRSHSTRA
jgi:hypothetical protein